MEITRKDVMNYHLLEPLIERNKKKLQKYKDNEPVVSVGKVFGSSHVFPFEARGFTVSGSQPEEYQKWKEWDQKCRYLEISIKTDIRRMTDLKIAIDELIIGIEDAEDKMIFEYLIEGKTQQWIAKQVGLDQSVVSRRIKKYLKL
ncbi:MAG: hypothetical protein K2N15_10720 [Lachnospiraceae bacterium]|nr:hypothetical protein [Lachnospiraceae bacterium]